MEVQVAKVYFVLFLILLVVTPQIVCAQNRDNTPPEAQNVSISNPQFAKNGQTLTGSYVYHDADGDIQGSSYFQWFRSGTENSESTYNPIEGANSINYTVTGDDINRFLKFAVIPKASSGAQTGLQVFSPPSSQVTNYAYLSINTEVSGFTESSLNNGSVSGLVVVNLNNSTFSGTNVKAQIENLPKGLNILRIDRITDVTIEIYLTGAALVHEASASILDASSSALKIKIKKEDMVGVSQDVTSLRGVTISYLNNPPTSFRRHSVGHNRVSLSWDEPAGLSPLNTSLTAYEVFRNDAYLDAVEVQPIRNVYTDYRAVSGENYTYQVRAVYGSNPDKPYSPNTIYATALAMDYFAIIDPNNPLQSIPAYINKNLQTIYVEMPNATNLSELTPIFTPNPNTANVKVNGSVQTSESSSQNFTGSHLNPIPYQIIYDGNGSSVTYMVTVLAATSLSYPVPRPGSGTTSSIKARWWSVASATSYVLDVSENQEFSSYLPGYHDFQLSGISQVIYGLAPDKEYYFRLRAYSSTLSEYSNYSPVSSIRTLPLGNGTGSVEIAGTMPTAVSIGTFTEGGATVNPALTIEASEFESGTDNVVEVSMGFAPSPYGLFYRLSFNNPRIGNGTYVFSYDGLTYTPQTAAYRVNGGEISTSGSSIAIDDLNRTITLSINGLDLSGKSLYTLDLLAGDSSEITLPIELSTFTAVATSDGEVVIRWTTESESGLQGFKILRSTCAEINSAQIVSPLIPATNASELSQYSFNDLSITDFGIYYYWLQIIEYSGVVEYSAFILVEVKQEIPIDPPVIPHLTGLKNIYPNPFNPSTSISYEIVTAGLVKVVVYNNRGQEIRTLVSAYQAPNQYVVVWDGKDNRGQSMPSGSYLIRLIAKDHDSMSRTTLLK